MPVIDMRDAAVRGRLTTTSNTTHLSSVKSFGRVLILVNFLPPDL